MGEWEKGTIADAADELRNIVSCDRRCRCGTISFPFRVMRIKMKWLEYISNIFGHPGFQQQEKKSFINWLKTNQDYLEGKYHRCKYFPQNRKIHYTTHSSKKQTMTTITAADTSFIQAVWFSRHCSQRCCTMKLQLSQTLSCFWSSYKKWKKRRACTQTKVCTLSKWDQDAALEPLHWCFASILR